MTAVADHQLAEWTEAVRKLGRAPQEWIGKHADSVPTGTVRDRIRRTWGVCHISGLEIRPAMAFELEHVIPLSMQGLNAERNLRPALSIEHRKKTRREAKERAKAARAGRAAFDAKPAPKQEIKSATFHQTEKRKAVHVGLEPLKRRSLYPEMKP